MAASKYEVRDATLEDAMYIADNLRAIDRFEITSLMNISYRFAIRNGMDHSDYCKIGYANDVPVAIFGVRRVSAVSDSGIAWMLATDDLNKHVPRFIRMCKEQVSDMGSGYSTLENWCSEDNRVTIRWLKWLGFEFGAKEPKGRQGQIFCHFKKDV